MEEIMNVKEEAAAILRTMHLQHAFEGIDHFAVAWIPKKGNLSARLDVMTPESMECRSWYKREPHRHIGTYHIRDVSVHDIAEDVETFTKIEGAQL